MPSPIDSLFARALASSPFATETVAVCADDTASSGGVARERVRVAIPGASVQDAGSPQFLEGADPAPWQFAIRFPVSAWTATVPLTAGSTVELDAVGAPSLLRVVQVQRVAGIYHLKCTAREGASHA